MLRRLTIIVLIATFAPLAFAQERVKEPTEKQIKAAEEAREREVQIQKLLERSIANIDLNTVGLKDAIDYLRDISGANMHVNWRAIEKIGVDRNTPVTLRLRDTSFRKVLILLLAEASGNGPALAWDIEDGVIEITTAALVSRHVIMKVYEVRDLLDPRAFDQKGELLSMIISVSIAPQSWRDSGGNGTIRYTDGKLIIMQTRENHHSIKNLLDGLRELRK